MFTLSPLSRLINANFTAAVILIAYGAVLGKIGIEQLLVMTLLGNLFSTLNEHVGMSVFGAVDAGGSIFIHTFGAYFGLACSAIATNRSRLAATATQITSDTSDLISLIGKVLGHS